LAIAASSVGQGCQRQVTVVTEVGRASGGMKLAVRRSFLMSLRELAVWQTPGVVAAGR